MRRRFAAPIAYDPNTGAPADGGQDWAPPAQPVAHVYAPSLGDDPGSLDPRNLNAVQNFARGAISNAEELPAGVLNLGTDAASAVGAHSLAQGMYRRALDIERSAQQNAPVSFSSSNTFGDNVNAVAGAAGSFVPTLALAAASGGVGGLAGRSLVGAAARGAAEDAATAAVDRTIAREGLKIPENIAADQAPEAAQAAARQQAIETEMARRAPAISDAYAPAYKAADKIGQYTGQAAAFAPQSATAVNDATIDPSSPDFSQAAGAKRLLGTGAADVASLLPFAMFKDGGAAAKEAIAKHAEAYLPRVVKAALKHGNAFGLGNAGATAAAMATHKWVDNNYDALTPQAFQQILGAYGSGAITGALLGGGREAASGIPLPELNKAHLNWLRTLGGKLGTSGQEVPLDMSQPEPLHPGAASFLQGIYAKATSPAARDAIKSAFTDQYGKLKDTLASGKTSMADFASRVYKTATDNAGTPEAKDDIGAAFTQATDSAVNGDADSASAVDNFQQNLDAVQGKPEVVEATTAPNQRPADNPVQMTDPLQNLLAAYIPHDNSVWTEDPQRVRDMAASAAKLLKGGKLTDEDNTNLALAEHLVGKPIMDEWRQAAPSFAATGEAADKTVDEMPGDAAQHKQEEQLARHETNDASELPDTGDEEAALPEGVNPAERVGNESTLAQQLDQATPGTPEHADLQTQLRAQVDRQGALATENKSSPKAAAFWNAKDPLAHANTIEVEPKQIGATKDGQPVMRRQALQLDNLVSKKLAEPDNRGNMEPKDALVQVLGDIQAAGHTIDPKSITPGVFYTAKDGASYRLTPNDVLAIRYGMRDSSVDPKAGAAAYMKLRQKLGVEGDIPAPEKPQPTDQLAPTSSEGTPARLGTREVNVPVDEHPNAPRVRATEHLDPETEMQPSDVAQGAMQDTRVDSGDLAPRKPPAGAPEFTGTGDVSRPAAMGNVRDVQLQPSPYEPIVNNARRFAENAKTPAQRAAVKHAAGIEIGEKELANERANGTISDKRFEHEMERLHDYGSGLSRKYLYDAAHGKYDSGRVIETPPDDPTIDRHALKQERDAYADKPIDDGLKAAAAPAGPHDHEAESNMVNALAKAAGIKGKLSVGPVQPHRSAATGGMYVASKGNIEVNDNVHGVERVEIIAHELGHHIFASELGALTGRSRAQIMRMHPDELLGARGAGGKRAGGLMEQHGQGALRDALAKDYDAWADGVRANPDAEVNDALASRKPLHRGEALSANSAGTTVAEMMAKNPDSLDYVLSFKEWAADHIARALTQQERPQSIIGKFFGGVADKLRTVYQKLFGTPEGQKYAPAPSVDAWVKQMFSRTQGEVNAALERTTSTPEANDAIESAVHQLLDSPAENAISASARFFNHQLGPLERRVLARITFRPDVQKQLIARYGQNEDMMRAMEDPAHEDASRAFMAYNMWRRGELKLGFHPQRIMQSVQNALMRLMGVATHNDAALRVFEDIKNGRVRADNANGGRYDLRQRLQDNAKNPRLQATFNKAAEIGWNRVYMPWHRYSFGKLDNLTKAATPALEQIGTMLKRRTGDAGADRGLIPTATMRRRNFHTEAERAVAGLSNDQKTALHQALQQRLDPEQVSDPKVQQAMRAQRTLFDRMHTYMAKAGVPVGEIEKYYPVMMDDAAARKDPEALRAFLSRPQFEDGIRKYFSGETGQPSKAPIGELVAKMVRYAQGHREAPTEATAGGRIAAEKRRLMGFVYKDGSPEDIKDFAQFQAKNPQQVMSRYIDSVVRRAESVRRFGAHGEKLEPLFKEAERQHARPEDIESARNLVAAANGRYASDGSPFVRKVFAKIGKPELGEKVNDKLFGPKGKAAQDLIMAYQNVRVLPLSLLSSLVDPLGPAVRMGGWKDWGDLRAHWTALHDGIIAAAGGKSMRHLRDLGDAIDMADDYQNSENLSNGYGGEGMSGLARKASDAMFKYNGMTGWTKATRYMALSLGQHFLLKHAADAEPGANGSARYLRELNVKASDIKPGQFGGVKLLSDAERQVASKEMVEADDRVRDALNRFVDESILRTDTTQHPLWMDDPAFRLAAQYKQFQYAFADQIIGRIEHELNYSNFHVLGPTMAYLPITMVAEAIRGLIQYGPGGNPHHREMGPIEYGEFAGQRAGILGPRMRYMLPGGANEGHEYAEMLDIPMGPSVTQAEDIGKTITGKRSARSTAIESLPASPVYQHRIGAN